MIIIIKSIFKEFKIKDFDDLYRRWEDVLDLLFYYNKQLGCGVPSIQEVRRYL